MGQGHNSSAADTDRTVGTPEPERLQLRVLHPDRASSFALPARGTIRIGRDPKSDVHIDHPTISRAHAELRIGDTIAVVDVGSANGTRIGSERVKRNVPAIVERGMTIELGNVLVVLQPVYPETLTRPADLTPPARRKSSSMAQLERLVDRVAQAAINVLFLGETGVGKEVFARRVHAESPRNKRPFIAINCAALSETLLESELFGHERGAFTGAESARAGIFEAAEGGTVFLDELGELAPSAQAKLLRALETREVTRLGSVRARRIDVRIVSATNQPLEKKIREGAFRADLFFRLNGFTFHLPPLRERTEEIGDLARLFVERAGAGQTITAAALERLTSHRWPGNVRELRTVVERAVLLAGALPVDTQHLVFDGWGEAGSPPLERPPGTTSSPLSDEVRELERARMQAALAESGGVKAQAARRLGMPLRTFTFKLRRYGLN